MDINLGAMERIVGLMGAGGFGREVMPTLRDYTREFFPAFGLPVFVERGGWEPGNIQYCQPVVSEDDFLSAPNLKYYTISVSNTSIRRKIVERIGHRATPISVVARTAIIGDKVEIGEGSILCNNTIMTGYSRIGRFFHANIFSYVSHECVIGDFVTFAPYVCCNGNITIEDDVYIGAMASIRDGKPGRPIVIGKGAVIGMGAVVTKSVPPGVTVVGNPARPIKRA